MFAYGLGEMNICVSFMLDYVVYFLVSQTDHIGCLYGIDFPDFSMNLNKFVSGAYR